MSTPIEARERHGDHLPDDWEAPNCAARHCAGNRACAEKRMRDGTCSCPCVACRSVEACVIGVPVAEAIALPRTSKDGAS